MTLLNCAVFTSIRVIFDRYPASF